MGRHSAPDDDDIVDTDDVAIGAATDVAEPAPASRPRPGRHSRTGSDAPVPVEAHALTDPTGIPRQDAPPSGAPETDDGGRIGRALPRLGGVVRTAAARTGPAPRPPADDDTSPGLAMIERALAGSRPTPLVDAPVEPPDATDETEQIPIIADPVLDEPVPEAVTENLRPVTEAPTELVGPVEQVRSTEEPQEPDDGPDDSDKAAKKAARKAAKQAAKQAAASREGRISDVALLRANSAVRARVAAAVVVPFVLYVAVLLVLDSFDVRTALIWIWIPLITAGVVGGLILDMAHRGLAAEAADAAGDENATGDQRSESAAP